MTQAKEILKIPKLGRLVEKVYSQIRTRYAEFLISSVLRKTFLRSLLTLSNGYNSENN